MKKVLAIALALFFVTATSGLVLAQGTTGTPAKPAKHSKKKHHKKKDAGSAPASSAATTTK